VRGFAGLFGVVLLTSCVGQPPPEAEPESTVAATEPEEEAVTQVRRPFLPDEMRRPGGGPSFPHGSHEQIGCANCHQRIPGHGAHGTLACAECHAASEQATQGTVSRGECMACHHSAERQTTCARCHDPGGLRNVQQSVHLGVWPAARVRRLPFDHQWHEAETCDACHRNGPTLTPNPSCASCHEDHHRPDARCMTCHESPATGAHPLAAHLGCSGEGCHTEPALAAMAQTRTVCLVCHQDQEQHEPGEQCAECHQVRPGEDTAQADFHVYTHDPTPQRKGVLQ